LLGRLGVVQNIIIFYIKVMNYRNIDNKINTNNNNNNVLYYY